MGAYYNWINQQRLPGAEQSSFIVWFEGHNQALAIGPATPRGTESNSPADLKQVLSLDDLSFGLLIKERIDLHGQTRIHQANRNDYRRKRAGALCILEEPHPLRRRGKRGTSCPPDQPQLAVQPQIRRMAAMTRTSTTLRSTASLCRIPTSRCHGMDSMRRRTNSSRCIAADSSFRPTPRGKHVFVDFEGVMTASTVWINGQRLGEYKGGYTPFSFELTPHLDFDGDNVLAVDVDSTERPDIPPFGYEIDYLTFGGIYREVALRIVPATFIENIFVRPKDVLSRKSWRRC